MALRTPLSVTPHLYMGDSTGRPLDKGVVYFGEQDKDPEFYPIDLFSDDALTKPLAQPVHTKGGYLYDKGDMVEPHAKEIIYSVKVLDSYGRKVFYKGAMMRNSWNDDVIEQINTAIIESQAEAVTLAKPLIEAAIDKAIISSGFVTIDSFELGATITQRNEALRHTLDGKLYRWAGDLPKVVPASSTPVSTGGFGANAWLEVSDTTLRANLSNNTGTDLVGTSDGVSLSQALNERIKTFTNLSQLRAYTKAVDNQVVLLTGRNATADGGGGEFVWRSGDKSIEVMGDEVNLDQGDGGVYISPTTDKTGLSGAWERVHTDKKINVLWYGIPDGTTDYTKVSTAASKAAQGGILHFPYHENTYITNNIRLRDNTTLQLDAGVVLEVPPSGIWALSISGDKVNVNAYGAKILMRRTPQQSNKHAVFVNNATNCSIKGLTVEGSGSGEGDCIYIGGDSHIGLVSKNVLLEDCEVFSASRNNISVVSCHGYTIRRCIIRNSIGNVLGHGIDLEANGYLPDGSSAVTDGLIEHCHVYENAKSGVYVSFADGVVIRANKVYSNGVTGIGMGAGGVQFNTGIYRKGDVLAITAINVDTGLITCTTSENLRTDFGLEEGMMVVFGKRGSGVRPDNVDLLGLFIKEISADNKSFTLSKYSGGEAYTSYTGVVKGNLTDNPDTSDLYFKVFKEGQSSNAEIVDNEVYGNLGASNFEIRAESCVNVNIANNRVKAAASGILTQYARGVTIQGNKVRSEGSNSIYGIQARVCGELSTFSNNISDFGHQGIIVTGAYNNSFLNDVVKNCGLKSSRIVGFTTCGMLVIKLTATNSKSNRTTYGLALTNVNNSVVTNCVLYGAGNSNAQAIHEVDCVGNRFVDNILFDGSVSLPQAVVPEP